MRYVGTRVSETNPLRSIPLLRPASIIQRVSATDRAVGDLRTALYSVRGYAAQYKAACKALGAANRTDPRWRRDNQRDAMRKLNAVRAAMRANLRKIATLEAGLLAQGAPASEWALPVGSC